MTSAITTQPAEVRIAIERSKSRPRWIDLPAFVRADIERLVGQRIESAVSCPGGYSPGFASRLLLADGNRVFVKAINAERWSMHADWHRTEARTAASLPPDLPVPRFLGSLEANDWVILAFECVDGREPEQPWRSSDLARVLAALTDLVDGLTPSPIEVPREHPRLGGWRGIADDPVLAGRLAGESRWATSALPDLIALEDAGLEAARGESLVHFDVFAENILLTDDAVHFVDWPHARLGAPFVDLVVLLSSVGSDSALPLDILLSRHPLAARVSARALDGVLAARAGFYMVGALTDAPSAMQPVRDAKVVLARTAVAWLARRLAVV